jgi:hypothetical protein
MTGRRPSHIPQRRLVYIGCEGVSEVNYAGFLQDLLEEANLPVHLVRKDLGQGAGDPLSRVEMAVRHLVHLRQTRIAPAERFVLLDSDQAERDPQRAERARRMAADNNITIVWQGPCFEAMLLRHLPGSDTRRPPETREAIRALNREWPDYQKPMSRSALSRRIDLEAAQRAAEVEPGLKILLQCLGLI